MTATMPKIGGVLCFSTLLVAFQIDPNCTDVQRKF